MAIGADLEPMREGIADTEPRLVDHFEDVARRYSDRLAISTDRGRLTYGELNAAANRLANLILARGSRGDRVALLLDGGPNLFTAMLAVLKSARICVILDPKDPPDRLRQIIGDAEPALIIAESTTLATSRAIALNAAIVALGEERGYESVNPELDIAPDEIAFLVYTSGSTGRPKAVMKSHGHVLLQPLTAGREMEVTSEDRILMLAALSGGQGVNTTWIALANGAALVAFPSAESGVTGLGACIADNGITIFVSSASLFRTFMKTIDAAARFPGVRLGTLAGDAATWQDFRAFGDHFPNGRMVTAFAASEAGYITLLTLDRDLLPGDGPLPVGRACRGREVRILDSDGRKCPPGVVGLVEVRGPHLASGYWRDPALTAKTFPIANGIRVFRSSDLGLLAADDSLVLKGRADAAVKIRGHRVDIAEVEKALAELPGVVAAAAGTFAAANGEPRLIAYIVPADPASASERRLRTVARATMARHLIPSAFVFLDQLPTTPNAKVDRNKLREIAPALQARTADPPATTTERLLARAWEEAFDLTGIGASDDFFALGGDSLVAAEVAARVHAETGVGIDLATFADAPILKDMAARIERERQAPRPDDEVAVVRAPRDRSIPLSLNQQSIWRITRPSRTATRYNMASLIHLKGDIDAELLRRALSYVVERHESLRTRFPVINDAPVQVIDPPADVPLPFADLSDKPDPAKEAQALMQASLHAPFDLTALPPVKFMLFRFGPRHHALLRSNHHIISDAPSWNTFMSDLAAAYDAFASGRPPDLPPLTYQYADYAVWQRATWRRDGRKYRDTIAWWKERAIEAASDSETAWRLPIMRSRPAPPNETSKQSIAWGLSPETSLRLDELAAAESATYFTVRLAALLPVLATLTGRDTVLFYGYFTRRNRAEFEGVFGLFVDSAPLLLRNDPSLTFRQSVAHVRRRVAETSAHADIPFDLLHEALAEDHLQLPRDPFRVHMPTQTPTITAAGLELRTDSGVRHARIGIQFWFDQVRERSDGCATYFDNRIFDPAGVRKLIGRIIRFSDEVSRAPDASIGEAVDKSGIARDLHTRG